MGELKKVAVLLATYNGEKYIRELLDSLMRQTYQNFVCYIHDDGSGDGTVNICNEYHEKYPDKVVVLDYPSTGGARNNFLSFTEHVSADYYCFCDQDDVWMDNKLELFVKKADSVKKHDSGLLVFSDLKIVDQNLNVTSESFYAQTHVEPESINYKNVLVKGYIPGCVMMIDDFLFQRMKEYNDVNNIKMHDWWLIAIAFMCKSRIRYISTPLIMYRIHSDNTIGVNSDSALKKALDNLKGILTGEVFEAKRKYLRSPRIQAGELKYVNYTDSSRLRFAEDFSNITNKNKIRRACFYYRHFKGVYRLWWLILWC